MKITKLIETRLDIKDMSNIFNANYDNNLLNELKKRFVKRCYKSIYILDITKIIKRSKLKCKNKVLDGSLYIDILFEVDGLIYEKEEVIHNCKIIQINNNIMHAKSEFTSLQIKNISGLNIFKESEEIPVIVNMVRYNIFIDEISVSAIPFIPFEKVPTVYKITNTALDLENIKEIEAKIKKLEIELKTHAKNSKPVFTFFRNLIYPFKKEKKNYGLKKSINIDSFKSLSEDDLLYRPDLYLDDDSIFVVNGVSELKDIAVLNINNNELLIKMFNDYYKSLSTLIGFLKNYDSDKIKSKSYLWKSYEFLKK
jgi:hypothetical protein